MMNSLLKKFYNNYAIIYVQYSPKSFYIKYYSIIRASHEQLTKMFHPHDMYQIFF